MIVLAIIGFVLRQRSGRLHVEPRHGECAHPCDRLSGHRVFLHQPSSVDPRRHGPQAAVDPRRHHACAGRRCAVSSECAARARRRWPARYAAWPARGWTPAAARASGSAAAAIRNFEGRETGPLAFEGSIRKLTKHIEMSGLKFTFHATCKGVGCVIEVSSNQTRGAKA